MKSANDNPEREIDRLWKPPGTIVMIDGVEVEIGNSIRTCKTKDCGNYAEYPNRECDKCRASKN